MPSSTFGPLFGALAGSQLVGVVLWTGLGVMTVALIALVLTRWGNSRPMRKCVALSVWAHFLLAVYTMTVDIIKPQAAGQGSVIRVSTLDGEDESDVPTPKDAKASEQPWEQFATELPSAPRKEVERITDVKSRDPDAASEVVLDSPVPAEINAPPPTGAAEPRPVEPVIHLANREPLKSETLENTSRETTSSLTPINSGPPRLADEANANTGEAIASRTDAPSAAKQPTMFDAPPAAILIPPPNPGQLGAASSAAPAHRMPAMYELRNSPQRVAVAKARGGSPETEAAVKLALTWLAAHQSRDGRWDASQFGAGRELQTLGHDRHGSGVEADTGVTGLALLAFLGAGHTHVSGPHAQTVTRGIEFLMRSQAANGHLGGSADAYAFMYCHGMATLALSEAYAMTGDNRLRFYVQRAVEYSINAQNRTTGGWRYRPGDTGDTSQLGWQVMALKSAELAGIRVPVETRERAAKFLASVSSGQHGGLASYRPGEQVSRTMSAEALACRMFLGLPRTPFQDDEAADYVLTELPDAGQPNVYYWYYATLALYQLQDKHWEPWNSALTQKLVGTQIRSGGDLGSWEPDPVWGHYGGRVYSTAVSALCLEVYYRYLPLYVEAAELLRPLK